MKQLNQFRLLVVMMLLVGGLILWLPKRQHDVPIGYVVSKYETQAGYTVTVKAYGRFIVSQAEYEEIEIGQKAPQYLIKRGE